MTAEEILKKSPTTNTEEPVYVNVGQWWASAEVDADVGFWADAPVGSLYHQNIPFGGTTSYVKVADNRVPSDWVRIQEQVPPDALTGLAAFIAGETVQRDEEAAALTRAKVRQAIDEMGRIAMPDPLRQPPANAQQAELDYWKARAVRAEGEVITADAEKEAACAVLFTVAEYIDNGVRPPAHVDIDGLYARMRDAVNGWRNGRQPL